MPGQSSVAVQRVSRQARNAAPWLTRQAAAVRPQRAVRVQRVGVRAGLNNGSPSNLVMPSKPKEGVPLEERALRIGLPSKGRMAEDTIDLLKSSQLNVKKINPRQYVAKIAQIPNVEVWFQRASDVVRKLVYGDVDLGIVGYDMFAEVAGDNDDLIVIHEKLGFGHCHLALGIPMYGWGAEINCLEDLKTSSKFTRDNPLRIVTGYVNIAERFFNDAGFEHFTLVTADGALEAAPAMGCADIILDLVSTGTTLKENNLKEIEGGKIISSEGVLVANKRALKERSGLLPIVKELIERLDAHLEAEEYFSVTANMYGDSPEGIATRLMNSPKKLGGLTGPTINNVYTRNSSGEAAELGFYAACICVKKGDLYESVKELRRLGGTGVLVQPMTFIFDELPPRWTRLVDNLDLSDEDLSGLVSCDFDAIQKST